MKAAMREFDNSIVKSLESMLDRGNKLSGYLNRVVYPNYQNAQRERWMTENTSQGSKWIALNPGYAAHKREKFKDYPGGGEKMLIATNRLWKAVVGPSEDHKKIVKEKSLEVQWTVEYAPFVDQLRNFTEFSREWLREQYKGAMDYIMKGEK